MFEKVCENLVVKNHHSSEFSHHGSFFFGVCGELNGYIIYGIPNVYVPETSW